MEYKALINKLMAKYFLPDSFTPDDILRAFANLSRSPEVLESLALNIAHRMVTQLKVSNTRSWREAAREAGRGREIYEALQTEMETKIGARINELVRENAKLISSIPSDIREQVNGEIQRLQLQGLRPEAVEEYLRKRVPQITRSRAWLIARTETSKAATALTQARSEDLGVEWAQWVTSEDSRVRPSHRNLNKVLMRWDDPPQPEALIGEKSTLGKGVAGNFPNCRCSMLPLISLDVIRWPCRTYRAGRIQYMTRAAFQRLGGYRIAA
jgi:SPP1 gp7 family putative phage head morphogenesis protein